MEKRLTLLFMDHVPGLRLRVLQLVGDALHAERILNALYLYSVCHAEELLNHPDPRYRFLQVLSRLIDQGDQESYSVPAAPAALIGA